MLSDETEYWRPVIHFPNYMMNQFGDIRNIRTGQMVVQNMKDHRVTVILYRDGVRYRRGHLKLYQTVFPDTQTGEVFEDWKIISDFPNYEISFWGQVRKRSTKRWLKPRGDSGVYFQLSRDGRLHRRSVRGLLRMEHGIERFDANRLLYGE